eukprot:CAMPEP_0171986982 /NCGR_PEP_ID=MMETSP0993-20121228/275152_1 /TAXON_ID=483369 /ORGANISM="non described non described, Strain CCMP2098" /LENGTH=459 /DNA_ID=CAMNT_0012639907 /DNA_START=34 /DNA_END=1413 /DNA_ORIENTATION=-
MAREKQHVKSAPLNTPRGARAQAPAGLLSGTTIIFLAAAALGLVAAAIGGRLMTSSARLSTRRRVAVPRLPLVDAKALIARGEAVIITDLRTPAAANWTLAYLEAAFAAHRPVVMTVATDDASRCCRYYEPRREALRRDYPYPFKPHTRLYKDSFAGFAATLRRPERQTLHYMHDVFFGDAVPAWQTPPQVAADMAATAEALEPAARSAAGPAAFAGFAHGKIWMGMQGVVMPLHYDATDNFYVPFLGRKKVVLVEPGHLEALGRYPNDHPLAGSARADVDVDELAGVAIAEAVVAPGDVLYLPANVWHQFEQPYEDTGALNFWAPPGGGEAAEDPRLRTRVLWDGLEQELVSLFGNRAGLIRERLAADGDNGDGDMGRAAGALMAYAARWKRWADGDDRTEREVLSVFLQGGRGLFGRVSGWTPGAPWDMSGLPPLPEDVARRCRLAPEGATFTHVCR